jgi:hypothetical protein
MTPEEYDDFLQTAESAVEEKWEAAGGRELTNEEGQELQDLLDSFFAGKDEGA